MKDEDIVNQTGKDADNSGGIAKRKSDPFAYVRAGLGGFSEAQHGLATRSVGGSITQSALNMFLGGFGSLLGAGIAGSLGAIKRIREVHEQTPSIEEPKKKKTSKYKIIDKQTPSIEEPKATSEPRVRIAGTEEYLDPKLVKKLGIEVNESKSQAPKLGKSTADVLSVGSLGALSTFFSKDAFQARYTKTLLETLEGIQTKGKTGTTLGDMTSLLPRVLPALANAFTKYLLPAAGLFLGVKDAIDALKTKGNEWFGKKPGEKLTIPEKISTAVGGFLGGTGTGIFGNESWQEKLKNVGRGAAKGAAIGVGVGKWFPGGIGMPVGAGIGAVAGAGGAALGGENIAKGVRYGVPTTSINMLLGGLPSAIVSGVARTISKVLVDKRDKNSQTSGISTSSMRNIQDNTGRNKDIDSLEKLENIRQKASSEQSKSFLDAIKSQNQAIIDALKVFKPSSTDKLIVNKGGAVPYHSNNTALEFIDMGSFTEEY